MNSRQLLFPLFSLFILYFLSGHGLAGRYGPDSHFFRPSKLFVFGDSYVDTGNINSSFANYPKFPYGITFPGKAFGRFSDGRVLTDYVARYLQIKSPIPYRRWEKVELSQRGSESGVNFAYGGTGVFDTWFKLPTMSTQIDDFQKLIAANSSFTGKDVDSSVALVSVSGNDYSFYLSTHGSIEGLKTLIFSEIDKITENLKRIQSIGVKKILVTALGPLGCVPLITASSSFQQCNETVNLLANFHNTFLNEAVAKLNIQTNDSPFSILDINGAFLSVIQNKGKETFKTPLKPCCIGISKEFSCGSVDEKGNKKYVLCEDPKSAFFWDGVHPTQEGWNAATSFLNFNF